VRELIKELGEIAIQMQFGKGNKEELTDWTYAWEWAVLLWKNHQWEARNQFRAFEDCQANLQPGQKLWLFDFAMTIALT